MLLLFGMGWLRKAILRSAGVIPLHDEDKIFAEEQATLIEESKSKSSSQDWIAGLAAFKAVLLEGLEVVFIVIAVGSGRNMLRPAALPAQDIEQSVLAALGERFSSQAVQSEDVDDKIKLIERVERIDVLQDVLNIRLNTDQQESDDGRDRATDATQFSIPWSKPSNTRKRRIIGQTDTTTSHRPLRSETRSRLLKGISQGRIWLDILLSSKAETIQTIADHHKLSEKTVRSTLSLALLAPDIVDTAIEARLPRSLTTTQMMDLSADWQEQREALGLV